jgi:ISXO2 transposase-like protein
VLHSRRRGSAVEVLPRVHLVASLLKRRLLGTHQGVVSFDHLDYYLDEFTFRFNRRTSRSRGKVVRAPSGSGRRGGAGPLQESGRRRRAVVEVGPQDPGVAGVN